LPKKRSQKASAQEGGTLSCKNSKGDDELKLDSSVEDSSFDEDQEMSEPEENKKVLQVVLLTKNRNKLLRMGKKKVDSSK